jgi:hypothetical protein
VRLFAGQGRYFPHGWRFATEAVFSASAAEFPPRAGHPDRPGRGYFSQLLYRSGTSRKDKPNAAKPLRQRVASAEREPTAGEINRISSFRNRTTGAESSVTRAIVVAVIRRDGDGFRTTSKRRQSQSCAEPGARFGFSVRPRDVSQRSCGLRGRVRGDRVIVIMVVRLIAQNALTLG